MQFRHAGKCVVRLGYATDTLNKRHKGVSNIYRMSRTRLGHITVQSVRQAPKPMSRKIGMPMLRTLTCLHSAHR